MWQDEDTQKNKRAEKWYWLIALTIITSFIFGGVMFYTIFHAVNHQIDRVMASIDRVDEQFDKDEEEFSKAMHEQEALFEKHREEFAQRFDDFQTKFHQEMHQKRADFQKELKEGPAKMNKWSNENAARMMADFKRDGKILNDRMQENFGFKPLPPLTGNESQEELQRRAAIVQHQQQMKQEMIAKAASGLILADELKKAVPELTPAQIDEIMSRRFAHQHDPKD